MISVYELRVNQPKKGFTIMYHYLLAAVVGFASAFVPSKTDLYPPDYRCCKRDVYGDCVCISDRYGDCSRCQKISGVPK